MEARSIKEYLHLYLGCEVEVLANGWTGTLSHVGCADMGEDCVVSMQNQDEESGFYGEWMEETVEHHKVKPLLRPLSDMTEKDLSDWSTELFPNGYKIEGTGYCIQIDSTDFDGFSIDVYDDGSMICISKDNGETYPFKGGELFRYLLSKGFDLFGLIDAGLALDKTKQPA